VHAQFLEYAAALEAAGYLVRSVCGDVVFYGSTRLGLRFLGLVVELRGWAEPLKQLGVTI
jgi:hypothetical protein